MAGNTSILRPGVVEESVLVQSENSDEHPAA
jgi:hypothetical protein